MRFWLGRQRDGNYMLCRMMPTSEVIRGTDHRDLYMQPGEPIGIRHLCAAGVLAMSGVELEPLGVVRVDVELTAIE